MSELVQLRQAYEAAALELAGLITRGHDDARMRQHPDYDRMVAKRTDEFRAARDAYLDHGRVTA